MTTMDDRLSFDVYANITNPPCRVEVDTLDRRVSVVIGSAPFGPPVNMLQLWFKDPGAVVALGQELINAGTKLATRMECGDPESVEMAARGVEG